MPALRLFLLTELLILAAVGEAMDLPKTKALDYGLRGPIKVSIERTTYLADDNIDERHFAKTFFFSTRGWLTEQRTETTGGPDYVTNYTYDAAGNLLRVMSGSDNPSAPAKSDTSYAYDDKGGLLSGSSESGAWISSSSGTKMAAIAALTTGQCAPLRVM